MSAATVERPQIAFVNCKASPPPAGKMANTAVPQRPLRTCRRLRTSISTIVKKTNTQA